VRVIQPDTGKDLTQALERFAKRYLEAINEVDGFVLKSRSPVCGVGDARIFSHREKKSSGQPTTGLFARIAAENYPRTPMEDEARLTNDTIRDHFLTQLFTLAAFREARSGGEQGALRRFHVRNLLLTRAYDAEGVPSLEQVCVRGHNKETWDEYERLLREILMKPPSPADHLAVLKHIADRISDDIANAEKENVLELIERYRAGHASLVCVQKVLQALSIRLKDGLMADQTYFEPYPPGLRQRRRLRYKDRQRYASRCGMRMSQ
jgi:uncharacterized protein YbgA (DUF1722 family)